MTKDQKYILCALKRSKKLVIRYLFNLKLTFMDANIIECDNTEFESSEYNNS